MNGNSGRKGGSSETPLELKFLGNGGLKNERTFHGEGMDVFWKYTIGTNVTN